MAVNIHFLGGADEVGASCILVEMAGLRLLVDAGIRVSPKARDGLSGEMLPDLSLLSTEDKLDAVFVTHAHADHIGAIPLVLGSIPKVPVYATPATMALMSVMYRDAIYIMDSRAEAEGELPQYDELQVKNVESKYRPVRFRQEFSIEGKVNATFFRAGHIPGAGSLFLQADDGSVLISGDLSFSPMRATPQAEIPPVRPNVLVLESTYGGKLHANRRAEESRLIASVTRVIDRGGKVLIPAFALGRAQEVALILDNAIAKKAMEPVPIYMDGMTRSITKVFERFPDYLSRDMQRHLESNMSLFKSGSVHYVSNIHERQAIFQKDTPYIVVSSSGMLTGGASPAYAQVLVGDERNAIFITGYQDEESPGKALQRLARDGKGKIHLNGRDYVTKCEIGTYSLSAHADENELTQFAMQLDPDEVMLVHGDGGARDRMLELIRKRSLGVTLPSLGQTYELQDYKQLGRKNVATVTEDIQSLDAPDITPKEQLANKKALYNQNSEQLNVSVAKKVVREYFPPPPQGDLRRFTINQGDKILKFFFEFPDVALQNYGEKLAELSQKFEGWEFEFHMAVNQLALHRKVKEFISGWVQGRPSVHMDSRVVEVNLLGTPDDWQSVQEAYQAITGFRLLAKGSVLPPSSNEVTTTSEEVHSEAPPLEVTPAHHVEQMEINQAYATIREKLEDKGIYKTGLKNGAIVVSFITPDIGERYEAELAALSQETGYAIRINPNANQFAMFELINELALNLGISLADNPSAMLKDKTIKIKIVYTANNDAINDIIDQFYDHTDWNLEVVVER